MKPGEAVAALRVNYLKQVLKQTPIHSYASQLALPMTKALPWVVILLIRMLYLATYT